MLATASAADSIATKHGTMESAEDFSGNITVNATFLVEFQQQLISGTATNNDKTAVIKNLQNILEFLSNDDVATSTITHSITP
jgi:hypothetical protein